MNYIDALQLIATGPRPDGTWNRDREECRQIAAEALGWHNTGSMTTTTEALRLAREALRARDTYGWSTEADAALERMRSALAAIDAAPSVEPVAQIGSMPSLDSEVVNDACWRFIEAMPHELPGAIFNNLKSALYAALRHFHENATPQAQPAAVPLTEAQIEDCIDDANRQFNARRQGPCGQQLTTYDDWKHWFARACIAEFCRVNGITPQEGANG